MKGAKKTGDKLVQENYSFATLPDLLTPDLELVFVGINPAIYAVQKGHYFARPTNRFWPAFSRSRLSAKIRSALRREVLTAVDDAILPSFGIGFTDVVKIPSRNVAALSPNDFLVWAPRLMERLRRYQPSVACFHGITGYRAYVRHGLKENELDWHLGLQERTIGQTRLYVVPNPSGANAHFTIADQISWYDRLADARDQSTSVAFTV